MIKREDLIGKVGEELGKMLEEDIQAYQAHVLTIETKEEALKEEESLIDAINAFEAPLKDVHYNLQEGCTYDNQVFNRKTMNSYVVDCLNLVEVEYSYTLGIYELVKLWETKDLDKIQYHAYDSTLRVLQQCKFRGKDQCKKILAVNTYLSGNHADYVSDTSYMIYLSSLHNALVDQINSFDKPEENLDMEHKPDSAE